MVNAFDPRVRTSPGLHTSMLHAAFKGKHAVNRSIFAFFPAAPSVAAVVLSTRLRAARGVPLRL